MLLRLHALKVTALTVLALVIVLGAEAAPALAESYLASEERSMLAMVNDHRASKGLKPLKSNDALRTIARRHTSEMASKGSLYHNPDLKAEVSAALPGWTYLGENVGVGPSTEAIQDAFLNSDGHRQNIENSRFNIVGIGGVALDDGRMYFTQVFAEYHAQPQPKPTTTEPKPTVQPKSTTAPAPAASVEPAPQPEPAPARPAAVPLPQTEEPDEDAPTPSAEPSVLASGGGEPPSQPKAPSVAGVLLAMVSALMGRFAFWQ